MSSFRVTPDSSEVREGTPTASNISLSGLKTLLKKFLCGLLIKSVDETELLVDSNLTEVAEDANSVLSWPFSTWPVATDSFNLLANRVWVSSTSEPKSNFCRVSDLSNPCCLSGRRRNFSKFSPGKQFFANSSCATSWNQIWLCFHLEKICHLQCWKEGHNDPSWLRQADAYGWLADQWCLCPNQVCLTHSCDQQGFVYIKVDGKLWLVRPTEHSQLQLKLSCNNSKVLDFPTWLSLTPETSYLKRYSQEYQWLPARGKSLDQWNAVYTEQLLVTEKPQVWHTRPCLLTHGTPCLQT